MICRDCEHFDKCVMQPMDCAIFMADKKPKKQTNEEWFCGLSTEEKARWLYDHYVNARAEEFYGRPEKTLCDYQKWLVDVHKKIEGTKIV